MRRTVFAAVAAALVAGAGLTAGSPAQAYDGRAVSPEGELRSVYRYALNRGPDRAERATHLGRATQGCKVGVLRFSFDVLAGREAARELHTPKQQTNGVFLALLDRAPDPSGWNTYLAMNRGEGLGRSTVDIMASADYRSRLARICAGRPASTVAVYKPDEVPGVVQSLLTAATVGSTSCAVTAVANRMRRYPGRAGLASVAAYSAEVGATAAGSNPTCRFAKQLALAAARAAAIGSTGHPVYVDQVMRTTVGARTRTVQYTFAIGPTPADTRAFEGSVTAPK
jgi:hypothetical protein